MSRLMNLSIIENILLNKRQIKNEAAFTLNVASREEILALEKLPYIKHTACQVSSFIIALMFFCISLDINWR
jgi:hypothetical protein